MSSLGTVASNKDSAQAYSPVILCAFTFAGQSSPSLLVSTHPFNSGEGGANFPGIGSLPAGAYLARVAQQDISALQARSQLGIDRVSEVKIHLADADHYLWTNFAKVYGFRGASVQMALVLWQPGTTNFSSDAPQLFVGTCDQELIQQGGNMLTISATNGHNTATIKLGNMPIQNRCPHLFPTTAAQRLDGATNPDSPYYACGYNPDQGSSLVQIGNTGPANHTNSYGVQVTDASGIFISCDYLRSNSGDATSGCMARLGNAATTSVAPDGDLMHDTTGRGTGRFAGITWSPGTYYAINKTYTTGDKIATFSFQNSAILGQYQNLLYGTQWVNCKIANIVEDGNTTKLEAMVCEADTGPVCSPGLQPGLQGITVTVNGVVLEQHNPAITSGSDVSDMDLRWNFTNAGGRNGAATSDTGYISPGHSALGDTYGSVCVFEACFYQNIFTGSGTPSVQCLANGPQLNVFTTQTAYSLQSTNNPAWVLLDILSRSNWRYQEINMASFIAAATFAGTGISYINQAGVTSSHARYQCEFSLESRKTAAEVTAGVLRSFNGYLWWDQTGLLNLGINQTLADQQPSPITGSNYNTAVSSITAADSSANGYVAYLFDETSVGRKSDGTPDLEFEQNATVQTPNRIDIGFQDQDNQYQTDSLSQYDTDAVNRAGGSLQPGGSIVPESLNVLGISNFDQATRIANVYLAERQRGNLRNDAGGTDTITFGTTMRAEHLRVGHLVFFSWQALGYSKQLFRITKIAPSTDFKTCRITMTFHKDIWYTDAYGQAPQSFYSATNRSRPTLPRPWQPDAETPYSDIFSATELNFSIDENDTGQADGSVLVQFGVAGTQPVNQVSNVGPPLVPLQATTSSTGGSIPGGTNWKIQICAIDGSGNYSAPSNIITASVPSGTNTNAITVSNLAWQAGTAGYDFFAGPGHWSITHQTNNPSSTPTSITWTTAPNKLTYGPPDLAATGLALQAKEIIHAGIIGCQVAAVTSTTITLEPPTIGAAPLTNNLTGYYVMLIAKDGGEGSPIPIADCKITSNSSYVLTVDKDMTATIPGTMSTPYLAVGDVVVVTSQANIASSTSIGDANYVSVYSATGTQDLTGYMVRIIAGTGRYQVRTIASTTGSGGNLTTFNVTQPWTITPDSTSLFIVEEPTWRYPATTTPLVSAQNYSLNTTLASVNVSNSSGTTMLVQALTVDANGNYSNEYRSPVRIAYLFGQQGAASDSTVQIASGT